MSKHTHCPNARVLQQAALGQVPAESVEDLARHLETCDSCTTYLHGLTADDSLLQAVRSAKKPADGPPKELVEKLMHNLARLRPAGAADTVGDRPGTPRNDVPDTAFLSPPEAPGEIGRLGGYRVLKVLGAGGMGMVLEAEDVHLKRRVALKVMHPALAASGSAKERFVREARATAKLQNDHVVTIHQVGEDRGMPFLAMQLLEGEPLDERLKREGTLPPDEVLRIGREMAEGLAAAHKMGLIHRDVKPANVWLEAETGRVKLLDFGLARAAADEHLTREGMILGTPAYMSPEQARGEPADHRADLFSLGSVLYRAATGSLPFSGRDTMSLLLSVATDPPKPPRDVNPRLPVPLADLILRLLVKKPEERPVSARDVVAAIREVERDLAAPRVAQPAPARRSRWPVAVALGLAAMTVAIVFGVVFLLQTPDGTLRVEVDDKEVEARFKDGEVRLYDADGNLKYTLKPSEKNRTLPPGEYRIEVKGADGLKLDTDKFEMAKNGKVTVRVLLDPTAVTGPGKDPGTGPVVTNQAGREKPFLLVRDGQPVREFKSLGGALAEEKPGDVIEVHGNGPFPLPGLELGDKPLTLRAASGYRPWFVVSQPINAGKAALDVEGCDFDARPASRFLLGTGGSWEFRRCRFWGGYCDHAGPSVRLKDCLLLGEPDFLHLYSGCTVEIENCLTDLSGAVLVADHDDCTVRLKDSTFVLAGFGAPTVVRVPDKVQNTRVEASGNLFVAVNSGYIGPVSGADCTRRVKWQGRENCYAGSMSYVTDEVVKTLADWNKVWGTEETGSHFAPGLALEWSRPNGLDWAGTRAWYQPLIAAAMRRHQLQDLGPDWDLIGPGDAYLKALEKASGKPIPKDRLRQEAPDGKPYVILRQGKEAERYASLHEAVGAAQDKDVVELRTDGPSKGASATGKGRLLTLRAAPGYSPLVEHFTLGGDDRLIIEGITFAGPIQDASWAGPEKGCTGSGGIVRLANCLVPDNCGGLFRGADGQPAEVKNCWVGSLYPQFADGGLRVTNSAVRLIGVDPRPEQKARLEIERCVLGNAEPAYPTHFNLGSNIPPPRARSLTVKVTKSWVQSPISFLWMTEGFAWECAGNVYRVPRGYTHGAYRPTLDSFRQAFKSDADSFEDLPSQLDPSQWRVRADSPGYAKRPDGRDFGADTARILGNPPTVVPATPPADKEKPFVLVRDGKPVGEYKTFAGVLPNLRDGDVIEVHGNGPFDVGKVELKGVSVTLKAAPGYRPQFRPHASVYSGDHFTWITAVDGGLTLEGCDFVGRPPVPGLPLDHLLLLKGKNAALAVRNCSVLAIAYLAAIEGKSLRVEDSLIAVTALPHLTAKTECHFQNNVVHATSPIQLNAPGGQRVTLRNNTFCLPGGANEGLILALPDAKDVTVSAEGNLFDFGVAYAGSNLPLVGLDWRGRVAWEGRNNLYRGLRRTSADGKEVYKGLEGWAKLTGKAEEGSREAGAQVFYTFDQAWGQKMTDLLPVVRRGVEYGRQTSGLDDLGPDLALVGPGDAYVKALAAAGKEVPRDQLRPEAVEGGPCVLLRAGKVVGGFATLSDAVKEARDGDVIEIRSDAVFAGFGTLADRGTLTVRAAPGYRPVIEKSAITADQPGTTLVLEGLHFRSSFVRAEAAKDRPADRQGRIARLANCSFESAPGDEYGPVAGWGLFQGPGDKPAEIVNCWVPFRLDLHGLAGSRVEGRNSVLGSLRLLPRDPGPCTVDIDRCAFWQMGAWLWASAITAAGVNPGTPDQKPADVRVTARRTLFESNNHLIHENSTVKWTGERNLYRIASTWSASRGGYGISTWRTLKDVKDEGSKSGNPSIWGRLSWRLLPQSPGYRTAPNGKDFGADIDRVAR